ncbi:hypothetical protein IMCC3317_07320 [Kordia antarctica]|uniref:Uncharacterized protein n=1 Tax=Kordia antarctica TaxID=1218801 RepID=A0A7L4ZGK7_9FLAO|nr:hypothetical protein [Kordia antarctica]QHI35386.1 hypothetical protein IMCC3317_07320 [Kordia antarctica]
MKKKNIKKLSLNKKAVSNLDEVSGGLANGPVPVGTHIRSGCPVCTLPKVTDNTCMTNCIVSCFWTCAGTCFPCW